MKDRIYEPNPKVVVFAAALIEPSAASLHGKVPITANNGFYHIRRQNIT